MSHQEHIFWVSVLVAFLLQIFWEAVKEHRINRRQRYFEVRMLELWALYVELEEGKPEDSQANLVKLQRLLIHTWTDLFPEVKNKITLPKEYVRPISSNPYQSPSE